MRSLLRVVAILSIPVGIAGFYNVYAEEPGLEAAAQQAACGDRGAHCSARMARQARTPFRRSYEYVVGGKRATVDCSRSLVFLGDYACARPGTGP